MLNEAMDEVVLVKGWKKGANWSFPRGKINQDEPDIDCAVREVYEETGYDIIAAGLMETESEKYIEMNLREQEMRLYVFKGIPMDTHFEPRTRKEISKIQWWKLTDLPTLRKKKQQEGKADDLAINANKFYMVAPFLPQLKKWINGQKKMEKARQSSQAPVTGAIDDDEETQGELTDAILGINRAPKNNEDDSVAESLQQLEDATSTSAPPVESADQAERKDLSQQLMAMLKGPITPKAVSEIQAPESGLNITETNDSSKSNSLLALLRGEAPKQQVQIQRTAVEQIIEPPLPPKSPAKDPCPPSPVSTLPPSPQTRISITHNPEPDVQSRAPQVRAIPPPKQPAQLIPRAIYPQQQRVPRRANPQQQVIAPYQRTGDPQFAQYAQTPGAQPRSIPPASQLPPPKLSTQSSTLLSLFKSSPSVKEKAVVDNHESSTNPVAEAAAAAGLPNFGKKLEAILNNDILRQSSSQEQPQVASVTTASPQNADVVVSEAPKALGVDKPKSEHRDKLLNLFRSTSVARANPTRSDAPQFLQLPSTPVELPALPSTPGHSREPSIKGNVTRKMSPEVTQKTPVRIEKRPRHDSTKLPKPSVFATVNGPLNVPQFDILAKITKDSKQAKTQNGHARPQKRSPITILARPRSSNDHISATNIQGQEAIESHLKQQKIPAPKLQPVTTPIKQPPAPDLTGHGFPPNSFHPKILRRPAHLEKLNEPSPIQPLPSPRHKGLMDISTTQSENHKESLLSLFSKPSPIASPISITPAPASVFDPTSLISPLIATPSPQEQAEAAFERLTKSVRAIGAAPQEDKIDFTPRQLSRVGSMNDKVAEIAKSRKGSGKHTPTTKTTTPIDKSFLLGYLENVAKGGR